MSEDQPKVRGKTGPKYNVRERTIVHFNERYDKAIIKFMAIDPEKQPEEYAKQSEIVGLMTFQKTCLEFHEDGGSLKPSERKAIITDILKRTMPDGKPTVEDSDTVTFAKAAQQALETVQKRKLKDHATVDETVDDSNKPSGKKNKT